MTMMSAWLSCTSARPDPSRCATMNVRLPSVATTSLATFCASSFLASAAPRWSISPDFQSRTCAGEPWATRAVRAMIGRKRFTITVSSAPLGDARLDEVGALAREDQQVVERGLEFTVGEGLEVVGLAEGADLFGLAQHFALQPAGTG